MSLSGHKRNDSNWISFSDIMTGLMVIFMFITISYMVEAKKKEEQRDIIFEEWRDTKEKLYAELQNEFKEDFKEWEVELDKDLSIKFTNEKTMFESGESVIPEVFKQRLNEFFPRYFKVLLKEKYADKIAEIRIEGHTDTVPAPYEDPDPYIGNIKLSQKRSAAVLKWFREMKYFKQLSDSTKQRLRYWITANGLSYGRTLDSDKELSFISGKQVNNNNSRRVEFRIITTTEELVDRVIKEMEK